MVTPLEVVTGCEEVKSIPVEMLDDLSWGLVEWPAEVEEAFPLVISRPNSLALRVILGPLAMVMV